MHIPCNWLKNLVRRYEVFHSHLHDDVVALRDLFDEGIAQVDPQPAPVLVVVAETKILLLQQTQRLAHLRRSHNLSIFNVMHIILSYTYTLKIIMDYREPIVLYITVSVCVRDRTLSRHSLPRAFFDKVNS